VAAAAHIAKAPPGGGCGGQETGAAGGGGRRKRTLSAAGQMAGAGNRPWGAGWAVAVLGRRRHRLWRPAPAGQQVAKAAIAQEHNHHAQQDAPAKRQVCARS